MFSVFLIVLPIFALIAVGWVARVSGVLGPQASGELNRFVVWLALPALLFKIIAKACWAEIWQPDFIAVFSLGAGLIFLFTVVVQLRKPRHLADATVDGLNSSYANTGFIGFPLAATVIGPASLAPTLTATIITVCVLFAIALILIEIGIQAERHPGRILLKVIRTFGTNPLLIAPIVGGFFLAFSLPIPQPLDKFLTLLSGAASPCALVALGLFIAESRKKSSSEAGSVGFLVALKLFGQPFVTWLLATKVFLLAPSLTATAVLMASLPTGTGPFMIAEFYQREADITARVVLASTVVSLLTITAYLSMS